MPVLPPTVWHPDYEIPLRRGHPFPMSKYGYLKRLLDARDLAPAAGFAQPPLANPPLLAAAHEGDWVRRVFAGEVTAEEERRIGLPVGPRLVRRARLSAAGTLLAARLALAEGLALNLAGGSHHAGPTGGAGFCVFNDVAVAAAALLADGTIGQALVVDLDVHQGDGTALIFAGDPRVFTLSVHAARNYPAVKPPSDLDIGLRRDRYMSLVGEVFKALGVSVGGHEPTVSWA